MAIKSRNLVSAAEDNSRKAELALRSFQSKASAFVQRELQLRTELVRARTLVAKAQVASQGQSGVPTLSSGLQQLLDRRTGEQHEAAQRLIDIETQIGDVNAQLGPLQDNLNDVVAAIQAAQANDSGVLSAAAAASLTTTELAKVGARVTDIVAECDRKTQAFESDRLFMYLLGRGLGTQPVKPSSPSVLSAVAFTKVGNVLVADPVVPPGPLKAQPSGLAGRIDAWLASISRHSENAERYALLVAMKQAAGGLEATARAARDQATHRLEAERDRVAHGHGEKKVRDELSAVESKLGALKRQAKAIQVKLDDLAHQRDPLYAQVCDQLANELADMGVDEMDRLASATENRDDDVAVRRMREIAGEVAEIASQLAALKKTEAEASDDLERAKRLERKLRESRYSSGDVEYRSSMDVDSLLIGYMAGRLEVDSVTREVLRHQQEVYVPPPPPPPSPPASTPSGSRSGDSGTFSPSSNDDSGSFSSSDTF